MHRYISDTIRCISVRDKIDETGSFEYISIYIYPICGRLKMWFQRLDYPLLVTSGHLCEKKRCAFFSLFFFLLFF